MSADDRSRAPWSACSEQSAPEGIGRRNSKWRRGLNRRRDAILLAVHRGSAWIPKPVRIGARGIYNRLASGSVEVRLDSWEQPIGRRPLGTVPHPRAPEERPPTPASDVAGDYVSQGIRCLIVTAVLDIGGIEEFVGFLTRGLPHMGVSICVANTGPPGGRVSRALKQEGIEVHDTGEDHSLAALIDRFEPEVISAHAIPDWVLHVAASRAIPVVETLHGGPTPIGTDWAREPSRSTHVAAFIAVGDMVRRQYLHGNPAYPSTRIVVVPNGFNAPRHQLADRDAAREWLGLDSEFLFVSLARLSLQKNAYGLVQAFGDAARDLPSSHLLLAGRIDNPLYARQVLRLRQSMPASVRDRIHIRDNTPYVPEVLAAADCFVMDSFYEGWSLASMEALAAGLPVVTSDVSGALEQVGLDGTRGTIVANPAGDPEAFTWDDALTVRFRSQANREQLASALRTVFAERSRWEARRSGIAAEARERFSPAQCLRSYASILDWVGRGKSLDQLPCPGP